MVLVHDRFTRPEKKKIHICICPEKQYFFRINSKPAYMPVYPLEASRCDFLDHDSFVELNGLVRNSRVDLVGARSLGRLSATVAAELDLAAQLAETMSSDQKDLIRERFYGPDGPTYGRTPLQQP